MAKRKTTTSDEIKPIQQEIKKLNETLAGVELLQPSPLSLEAITVRMHKGIILDEKIKKTEVAIREVPRLDRPAKGSLIGTMFSSSVGIVCMLLLYAANIYAGYEIATVRAHSPAMVCGISAVAPIIGPVIFLCLPTKMPPSQDEIAEEQQAAPAEEHSASYNAPPGQRRA